MFCPVGMVVDGTLVNVLLGVHGGGRYIGKCVVRCAWWWTVHW